jgi:hypothetical protein
MTQVKEILGKADSIPDAEMRLNDLSNFQYESDIDILIKSMEEDLRQDQRSSPKDALVNFNAIWKAKIDREIIEFIYPPKGRVPVIKYDLKKVFDDKLVTVRKDDSGEYIAIDFPNLKPKQYYMVDYDNEQYAVRKLTNEKVELVRVVENG